MHHRQLCLPASDLERSLSELEESRNLCMKKWSLPSRMASTITATPLAITFSAPEIESDDVPSTRKEAVLRRSLELARSTRNNEEPISDIVEKALDAGLFDLAYEALQSFGPKSNHLMCWTIRKAFEPEYWSRIPPSVPAYCEKRLRAATECRAGMYMGHHQPDNRSDALANLGLFFLAQRDASKAFDLWSLADEPLDIDVAISNFAKVVAEADEDNFDAAMMLVELINSKRIKASALANLSDIA